MGLSSTPEESLNHFLKRADQALNRWDLAFTGIALLWLRSTCTDCLYNPPEDLAFPIWRFIQLSEPKYKKVLTLIGQSFIDGTYPIHQVKELNISPEYYKGLTWQEIFSLGILGLSLNSYNPRRIVTLLNRARKKEVELSRHCDYCGTKTGIPSFIGKTDEIRLAGKLMKTPNSPMIRAVIDKVLYTTLKLPTPSSASTATATG